MKYNDMNAFPLPNPSGSSAGMTLRDYFAAKFLQGCAAHPTMNYDNYELAAKDAYKAADAMLNEREK